VIKYVLAVLFGTLGAVAFVCGIVYAYTYLPVPHTAEADPAITVQSLLYADDPAMLYKTVGIKECGYETIYKIEKTPAVLIHDDDLALVKPFIQEHFKGEVIAALYTNAPEATVEMPGQPALIPLRKENGTYCALGIAGSYSTPLFLELKAKYQPLINQQ
jgi:hypothetical protein